MGAYFLFQCEWFKRLFSSRRVDTNIGINSTVFGSYTFVSVPYTGMCIKTQKIVTGCSVSQEKIQ